MPACQTPFVCRVVAVFVQGNEEIMEDGVENIVKFIKAVERYVVLYDYTDQNYSNRRIQEKAWKEVGRDVNMTGLACKEKWKNIRSAYTRYLRQKLCSATGPKKKYYLAEHLRFLLPFTKSKSHKGNTCNIQSPPQDTNEEVNHFTQFASDKDSEIDYNELQCLFKTEDFCEETDDLLCEDTTANNVSSRNASSPNASRVSPNEFSKKRKDMDPLEICSTDYLDSKKKKAEGPEDADLHFLKSLLPDLHKMSNYQKYEFKYKTMKLIGEILYQSPQINTNTNSTKSRKNI